MQSEEQKMGEAWEWGQSRPYILTGRNDLMNQVEVLGGSTHFRDSVT